MSIEPSTLIFALINFFILLFCLKKFLYKPLFNMLDERASTIAKNVDDAEQARNEANALKAEYEASLKQRLKKLFRMPINLVKKPVLKSSLKRVKKLRVPAKRQEKKSIAKKNRHSKICVPKLRISLLMLLLRSLAAM